MIWPVLLAAVALLVAFVALASARRTRQRLEQLQQSYWDLRYEHGRLKAQVKRLDPEEAQAQEPEPAAAPPSTTFIPLSSLKR
jgi:hypothetical protein